MDKERQYSGFIFRLLVYLTDLLLMNFVLILGFVLIVVPSNTLEELVKNVLIFGCAIYFPTVFLYFLYSILTTHYLGGTIGKLAVGLKVVNEKGQKISLKRAFFRQTIGYMLSGGILFAGFLSMIKNPKKQGWHDEIVGSFVIQRAKIWFVGLILALLLIVINSLFVIGAISAFSQKQQIGNEIAVLVEAVKIEIQKQGTSNSPKSSMTQSNSLEEQNKFTSLIQEIKLTWSSGKYEESLSMAKSSLDYAKNNADKSTTHYWIGLSYYKLEDYVNSEKEMKTAVDLDPSFVGPYNTLSALSMTKNDYQTALEYAKKCAEADNNYAWCHNALGLSYLGLGEREKGIEELRQSVKLAPESVVFQDNLNRALQKN